MTAFAVLAYALGIGITTAVFSLFYGVLLKPLPYPIRTARRRVRHPAGMQDVPGVMGEVHRLDDAQQVFSVMGGSMTSGRRS